jgi:hypothetical protein
LRNDICRIFLRGRIEEIVGLNPDCRSMCVDCETRRLFYFALDRGGKEGYFILLQETIRQDELFYFASSPGMGEIGYFILPWWSRVGLEQSMVRS